MKNLKPFLGATIVLSMVLPAYTYPIIDQEVPTAGEPIHVYRDHALPGTFWYIPLSIEPWTRDNRYKSALYESPEALTFIFRGQPSVDENTLRKVAAANNTRIENFAPVAYEYSKDFTCQNIYASEQGVNWQWPVLIGNYLEIVPVSLRVTTPSLIREISHVLRNGGLACTVKVGFKGVGTAYNLVVSADLNQLYSKFQSALHAEGVWWEVDLKRQIEKLRTEQVITIKSYEDQQGDPSVLDKQIVSASDEIMKQIITRLFKPVLKLPDGNLEGRGKAWSLRSDYRASTENAKWRTHISSDKVRVKDSSISVRMSL